MSGDLIISLHDVAPGAGQASRKWLDLVERFGMRASLLVVPGPWRGGDLAKDDRFAGWLRDAEARGHELVLHGWEHRATAEGRATSSAWARLYGAARARGCAEFHDLSHDAALRRLQAGLTVLRDHGIEPEGFTPPGWLASSGSISALRQLDFAYTTTQWSVHDLRSNRRIQLFATSQRPGSRLARAAALANERIATRQFQEGRSMRLALHPDDLNTPALRASIERTLGAAMATGMRSITYGELVAEAGTKAPVAA